MSGINGITPESLTEASSAWLMVLSDAALKGLAVLLVAAIATTWMRRASAATRHLVWLFAALSLLALPVFSVTLPEWNVLPSWMGWAANDTVSVARNDSSLDLPDDSDVADSGTPSFRDRPLESESRPAIDASATFIPAPEQPESLPPQEREAAVAHTSSTDTVAAPLPLAPSAEPQSTPVNAFPWQAWVLVAWAAGSFVAILPVVLGGLSLSRLKRSAIAASETHLTTAFHQAVTELGIRRRVMLLLSDRRYVPMQWGTWRPILLLPDSAREWSPDRLQAVFLHELAHVRRNDCLVRMLVHFLCAVYWFNPLMWIARRRLQIESETACDDLVIRTGIEPRDYARHLLEVVTGLRKARLTGAAAVAMASRTKLETRILAILDPSRNRRRVTRLVAIAALTCLLGLTVPLAVLHEASVGALEDASVEHDSKARKKKAEKFIELAQEKRFREAVGLFDPTLFPVLPYVELKRIWDEFEKRCGSFREAISYAERDFPKGRLLEIRGRWDRAVMLIRLAFDQQNRISGFWLARDREGPTPEHFRRGGYMFGAATERIVGLDHSLTVRVLGADGEPLEKANAALWRQVVGTPNKKQTTWDDPETGASWARYTDGYGFWDDRDKSRSGWKRLPTGVYRVTAAHANTHNDPRSGTGPPVRLDDAQKTAETAVQLRDGPSLVVRVVDARSGEPIDSAYVAVRSKEPRSPRSGRAKLRAVDGAFRRDHLPPGPYGLHVSKSSYHPSDPKYVADKEEIDIEIVAGKDHEITVKVKPVPLTQEEIDKRWPWIAEGTVTDAGGNPLAGVDIWAYVGMGGTIQGQGPATTDARGHYTLRFGVGGRVRSNPPGDPPLRMQSGGLHAWKDGYVERNFDRHAWVIVADRMPKEEDWQNHEYIRRENERVVLPGKPRRIDFVMVSELAISGRLVDERDEPIRDMRLRVTDETISAQNSLRRFSTDKEGRFSLNRIPPGHTWWFTLVPPEADWTIQSLPLRFGRSGKYEMLLRLVHDEATGIEYLQLVSLTDAEGNQRREEVVGDTPLGRPPVEPELQAKGREVLAQIAKANCYWLGLPPKEVRSYRYTFTAMGDGPGRGTKEYEVRDDSGESFPAREMEATHAKRHGITYFSALHYLTAHPEDVAFRQVEFDEDEIRLAYFFKNRVWLAASYCLFASRNGFHLSFSDIREGTVVLDRETLTPREHVNPWFRETFSDYAEIQPDHYVPLNVRFKRFDNRSQPEVHWEFKVYKPGLWLFDTYHEMSKDGEAKIMASIDNVKVNGKPAELAGLPDVAGDNPVTVAPKSGKLMGDWPLFRGNAYSTGVATSGLPDRLAMVWKFTVEKGSFEGTPAILDGVVYIGDLDGKVYALDLRSGKPKWEYETQSGFIASPAAHDGRVYIGDYDGRFYCLNAADGKLEWEHEAEAQIDSSANFFGDNVLFGSQDAVLYCLNAKSGRLVWKHQIEDQIRCTPTIVEGRCFLAGCDGQLHVVELTKGEEVTSVEIQAPTGVTPAAVGDRVYFGTEGAAFFCVDWRKAEVLWTFSDKGGQPFRSCPAATKSLVVVGGQNKRVHALNPMTGEELWKFAAKSRVDSSPVIVGNRVFAASTDGRLYALDLKSGRELWQYETGGGFVGSPAVADGRLVIANDDGVVYCFGEKRG